MHRGDNSAALAMPPEFSEAVSIVTLCGRHERGAYISARRLHGLFGSARQFHNWIEYRETQRLRRRQDLPRLNAECIRTKPAIGRPFLDYLLTSEQARFLADCDKSPAGALVYRALAFCEAVQALRDGANAETALRTAGQFPVIERYTVPELAALLGEIGGYPASEFGWRKRLERENRYCGRLRGNHYQLTPDEIDAVRLKALMTIQTAQSCAFC